MEKLKCEELLKESEKEYKKIADAINALLKGEISGKDVNKISSEEYENN